MTGPLRALGAGLLAAASTLCAPVGADTLIDHVDGLSFDKAGNVERFSGILIGNDGRIAQVFKDGDRRPARVDYLLDGKGRTVLPGLVDAHAEVMELGLAALTLDLSGAKSLAEAQARVAAYAAAHPDRAWIVGRGWDGAGWGTDKRPGAAELDSVLADRPVWLVSSDGHAGWANSAALKAAGITALTKDPAGGKIERAAPGGKPTGALLEAALGLIEKAVPAPRPEDRDMAFAAAQDLLLARGVTAVTDMGTTIEDWQSYRRAGDAGRLRVRVLGYAEGTEAMSLIGGPGPTPWLYDDRLKLNGVKLTLDGTLIPRGAWLKAPYADAASTGLPRLNPTQLRNLMSRAAIDKFQVAVEANGDAATAAALDAIGELTETYKGDRRWRIEGAERVDGADLSRLASQGTVASLRPGQLTPLAGTRLGAERGATTWPAASLAKGGALLAFGSGASAGSPAPFASIAAAASRTDVTGQPFGGWQAAERISREAALAAWTAGAAQAAFAESKVGRIAPGLQADFIVIDRDPLMAGASELAATKVLETWVGGRKVWAAPGQ